MTKTLLSIHVAMFSRNAGWQAADEPETTNGGTLYYYSYKGLVDHDPTRTRRLYKEQGQPEQALLAQMHKSPVYDLE
jgi:hypothetical protein